MERVRGEIDGGQLGVGHLYPFGILVLIELGAHPQAGVRRRRSDQLDDRTVTAQRLAPPVDGDEREQAMLDLVPLAGSGRQVANRDGQLELVGQLLQLDLPQPHTIAVAAAAVGGDQQPPGGGVALPAHGSPPSADRADGEACGVVIGADADPTDIVGDVVDPVRHGAAQPGIDEVVNLDRFGHAGGRQSRPLFLKLPTNSFFFVSTEMTGSRAARNALAWALI